MNSAVVVVMLLLVACGGEEGDCLRFGSEACVCGPTTAMGGEPSTCSPSLGAGAYCCAATNVCVCARPICFVDAEGECSCNWGGDGQPLGSRERTACTPPSGGVCCREDGEASCYCTSDFSCIDSTEVASCTPADVTGCGDEDLQPIGTCDGFVSAGAS